MAGLINIIVFIPVIRCSHNEPACPLQAPNFITNSNLYLSLKASTIHHIAKNPENVFRT